MMNHIRSVTGVRRLTQPLVTPVLLAAVLGMGGLVLSQSAGLASADTIELTDGTVLEGTVKPIGSSFRITLEDGSMKIVKKDDIASINGEAPGGGPAVGGKKGQAGGGGGGGGPGFSEIKTKADRVEAPIIGVSLWEQFLKQPNLDPETKKAAEEELAYWQALVNDGAERIRGKWVGGEEREALMEKVRELIEEGADNEDTSTRKAIAAYQRAIQLYPNSYEAHFRLGYFNLVKGGHSNVDAALRSLQQAVRIRPESPEALNNLAIAYNFDRNYTRSVECMWKAVQETDDKELVQNLANALDNAPSRMLTRNALMRRIMEDARPLFQKHGVGGGQGTWIYLPPGWSDAKRAAEGKPPIDAGDGPPGIAGNGSGFFVTPDGYLLTNEHVAGKSDGYFYRVRLDGKDEEGNFIEYLARVVAVDDEHDVALLKVDLPEGVTVPYLTIQPQDFPPVASQVMVLGYPATGLELDKASMQVDIGTVKSNNEGDEYEVWFDLSTTHGNSGGPIVDRNGDVVAILSAGRTVYEVTYVLGVGARQIRDFLSDVEDAPELPEGGTLDRAFDGEDLAAEARQATLLVLIVRGELPDDPDVESAEGDEGDDDAEGDGAGSEEPPAAGGAMRPDIGTAPSR